MKRFRYFTCRNLTVFAAATAFLFSLILASCSSDEPPQRSEYDIIGLWSDAEGHYIDFSTPETMYSYSLETDGDYSYWLKKKPMYFFEPYSYLLCMMDAGDVMQVYQVVSVSESELVTCWVATPNISSLDGDSRLDFLKIFFDKSYVLDRDKFVTYKRMARSSLDAELEGKDLVEF